MTQDTGIVARMAHVSDDYKFVAPSSTNVVLGTTGAVGDRLDGLRIIPASLNPGSVTITDGTTGMVIFAGGTASLATLTTWTIPLGILSANGVWKITTGANVSVLATGSFT